MVLLLGEGGGLSYYTEAEKIASVETGFTLPDEVLQERIEISQAEYLESEIYDRLIQYQDIEYDIEPEITPLNPIADRLLSLVAEGQGISVDALVYNIDKILPIPNIIKAVQVAYPLDDLTIFEQANLELEYTVSEVSKSWSSFKKFGIPILIGLGVLGSLLVGYQYSKSYITEKGKTKARGK